MKKTLQICIFVLLILNGCRSLNSNDSIYGNAYSTFSDVSINGLPQFQQFGDVNNIQNLLNAYHIQILPQDSNCEHATKIDEILNYEKTSFDTKIYSGCSYNLNLRIGCKKNLSMSAACENTAQDSPNNTKTLDEVYYQTLLSKQITSQELKANPKFKVEITLTLTDKGKERGFKDKPQQISQNNNHEGQNQETPLAEIFSSIHVKNAGGQVSALSDHFRGKYLLIEFSMMGCNGCVTLAQKLALDQEISRITSEKKCSMMTILRRGDNIQSWFNSVFNGKANEHTYSASSFNTPTTIFGVSISAMPTSVLISRDGNVKSRWVGDNSAILQEFKSNCL